MRSVHLDLVDGLDSDPEVNHLVIRFCYFFFLQVSVFCIYFSFYLPPSASRLPKAFKFWSWQLFATQTEHQLKKMNLLSDRGDSQLTESVRAPDADVQPFLHVHHLTEKGSRRRGRDGAGTDLT